MFRTSCVLHHGDLIIHADFMWYVYHTFMQAVWQVAVLDIRGMNDIILISKPIHAPSHELEDTDTNTPPTKVISKRIFVELLGIREEYYTLFMGYEPISLF